MLGKNIGLEELINAISDLSGVTLQIHKDFKPLVATREYARMYGFETAEEYLKLQSIMTLIPEDVHDLARERYQQIIETGSAEALTIRSKRLDGSLLWLKVQDRRLKYLDDYCVLTVLVDITEEVEIKEKFEQLALAEASARKELQSLQNLIIEQEKQAAVNNLLVGVSHQLNTPLGNIRVAATSVDSVLNSIQEKLRLKHLTEEELSDGLLQVLEAMSIVDQNVRVSDHLIQNVKKMVSRVDDSERTHFHFRSLIEETLSLFLVSQTDVDVDVDVQIDDQLHTFANPNVWMQVVSVLCENCLKHAFTGRTVGRVRVLAAERNGGLQVEFSDNGIGIPESEKDHVFEAFYSSQMGQNSGLGLTLLYNRIDGELGGSVELIPPVFGQGVSIRMNLPLADFSYHAPTA